MATQESLQATRASLPDIESDVKRVLCDEAINDDEAPALFLLITVTVAAHELVYAACGVDELLLAGEEGVRGAGDFKLDQRIGHAVNFDSFL